jgi:hypothetical protein
MSSVVFRAFAGLSAIVALSACGGGGGGISGAPASLPTASASAAPTPTPTPPVPGTQTIDTSQGSVSGETGMFDPTEGDTASGGQGSPIDNIDCEPTMSNNYHVHIYLGVFVNGTQMALPTGIGMQDPGPAVQGFVDTASCFYFIHTHDSSGIVHVEDPNPDNAPITSSIYTLQNVLDVWGITADANHFGPFTGPVEVFTSGPVSRGGTSTTLVPSTTLTYYGANPNTVPLYSHEVVFVEVGPTFPSSLPSVNFYLQY